MFLYHYLYQNLYVIRVRFLNLKDGTSFGTSNDSIGDSVDFKSSMLITLSEKALDPTHY